MDAHRPRCLPEPWQHERVDECVNTFAKLDTLDTGMRRGEMLALRFADIDWIEPPAFIVAHGYRK